MECCSLMSLPGELLIGIFKYLDVSGLLRCAQVCAGLRDVIKDSLELQYCIELAADGLVDGIGCTLSTAERLELLLERRRRWRYLDWTKLTSVTTPCEYQAYDMVSGVYGQSCGRRHLAFTRLPTRDVPENTTQRDDLGVSFRDFAMDPSQDLLVLVDDEGTASLSVHIWSLCYYKPHPKAAAPDLHATVPFIGRESFTSIVDDVVGTFWMQGGPGLIIWNWRTGMTIVARYGIDLPHGTYDFSFISSRAYMLTIASRSGSLELYTFGPDGDTSASWYIDQVAVLHLPPTKLGQNLRRYTTTSPPFIAKQTPGRPFETSHDSRLHVMALHYGLDAATRFNLFMHNRFLLSFIPSGTALKGTKVTRVEAKVVKDWDDWGPRHTRLLPFISHFPWLRHVHGTRVVFPPMLQNVASDKLVLLVTDFGIHPKRSNDPIPVEVSPMDGVTYKRVTTTEVVEPGVVFQDQVLSTLPFSMTARANVTEIIDQSAFIVEENQLVGLRTARRHSDNMYLDVYTF